MMDEMVGIQIDKVSGSALDWAVAKAIGLVDANAVLIVAVTKSDVFPAKVKDRKSLMETPRYSPSTDWSEGGPLLDRYPWAIPYRSVSRYHLGQFESKTPGGLTYNGNNILVAACRAIVAAEFGVLVEVPKLLIDE